MGFLVLILLIVFTVIVIFKYAHAYKMPKCSVVAFTGTMGSGKTFSAVRMLKAEYRWRLLIYYVKLVVWAIKPGKAPKPPRPVVYANIPVRLSKRVYALPVTDALLSCEDYFPENTLLLLDEISVIADQYDYDDPLVVERMGRLLKFFRHWTGGKIFLTEQAISCVTKPLRDKLGFCYQCEGLSRWLGISPFVEVRIMPVMMVDADTSTSSPVADVTEGFPYLFFWQPYFWLQRKKKRAYDSRCYSRIYREGAVHAPDFDETLKTRYLCDLVSDTPRKKSYKSSRAAEKDWIFKSRDSSEES